MTPVPQPPPLGPPGFPPALFRIDINWDFPSPAPDLGNIRVPVPERTPTPAGHPAKDPPIPKSLSDRAVFILA